MNSDRVDVIVPMGGSLKGPLADQFRVHHKAMLPFKGSTLAERTIKTVRESGLSNRIVVPGASDLDLSWPSVLSTHGGSSAPKTILNGIDALPNPTDRVLIVTCDLPFLSVDALRTFVHRAPQADFVGAAIRSSAFESTFPGSTNTYVSLRDGAWTLGGVFLARTSAFRPAMEKMELAFQNRKSVFGMAKLLGLNFLLRFIARQVGVDDVVKKIESILMCKIGLTQDPDPVLAYDIDDLDDYEYSIRHHG